MMCTIVQFPIRSSTMFSFHVHFKTTQSLNETPEIRFWLIVVSRSVSLQTNHFNCLLSPIRLPTFAVLANMGD